MATGATTNFQIPLFGDGDFVTPIQTPLNAQANALDTALTKGAYLVFATKAAMDAAPGTIAGQHATVNADPTANLNGDYVWAPGSPGSWVPATSTLPSAFVCSAAGTQSVTGSFTLITAYSATPDIQRGLTQASGVITVNQAGIYDVAAMLSTPPVGVQSFIITKNSATISSGVILQIQQNGTAAYGSRPIALAAGDQIRLFGAGPSASQTVQATSFISITYKTAR